MEEESKLVFDLRNNGRKKLLFLGKTGAGKSALCNALSVPIGDKTEVFPESANIDIGNTATILSNTCYLGSPEKKASFVDTVGFDSTEKSNTEIAEFVVKLKECCDFINVFAVVLKSPSRIEKSLEHTIDLCVNMFGKDRFWGNVVFIISGLRQSNKEINWRKENTIDDDKLTDDLSDQLKKIFELDTNLNLPFLIIDAKLETTEEDQRTRFETNANTLYNMLIDTNRFETSVDGIMKVTDKYDGLKEAIVIAEKEHKQLQDQVKKQQEEKERLEKIIKRFEEEAARSRETERTAREDAARLQVDVENARRNGYFELVDRLRPQVERAQQNIVMYCEEGEKFEKKGADAKWKYYLVCAILAVHIVTNTAIINDSYIQQYRLSTEADSGPTFNLRNNGRKKLLFLGKTGVGKSALCNALSVPIKENEDFCEAGIFPESTKLDQGNRKTFLSNVCYLGSPDNKISFIDTVGFDGTENSNTEIAEFIVKLQNSCDFINLFAVVLYSPKRIEDSLKDMIHLLVNMFGEEQFWTNVVFIISNLQQSDKQVEKRKKRGAGDDKLKGDLSDQLKKIFKLDTNLNLHFLIIDAKFDTTEDGERVRFEKNATTLYNMLIDTNRTEISVDDIKNLKIIDKYDGLKEAIDKAEKVEKENKQLQDQVKKQQEEKERQEKIIKRKEEEAARSRESERNAREDAARLQTEVEDARRNGDLERAERLHLKKERAQQEIVRYCEQGETAEEEAAILAALTVGGAAGLAGATIAGIVDVKTLKAFLVKRVAPQLSHLVPFIVTVLKKQFDL